MKTATTARDPALAQMLGAIEDALALARGGAGPAAAAPVRTLHHFACTGGTLIAKCVAALPAVQLLSEVDPLSTYAPPGDFTPTDMVMLLRRSSQGVSDALLAELFAAQVRVLHADAQVRGQHLVLRDHAHSHFCHGAEVEERPTLRELMPAGVPLLSLVSVRHPLDSFVSLAHAGWLHFEPRSVDAYCRRYHLFLDRHDGLPVLRYEDFVAAPQAAMQALCRALALDFDPRFAERFGHYRLSGDSGRSGERIAARPSRPEAVALEAEAAHSEAYRRLVQRLGYGLAAGATLPNPTA